MPLTRVEEKASVEKALQQRWEIVRITKYSGDNAIEWEDSVTLNMATRHCAWILTETRHGDTAADSARRPARFARAQPAISGR